MTRHVYITLLNFVLLELDFQIERWLSSETLNKFYIVYDEFVIFIIIIIIIIKKGRQCKAERE